MLMVSASQSQPGGGLVVYNGGTAMLTDVNVYSNTVSVPGVCYPVALAKNLATFTPLN